MVPLEVILVITFIAGLAIGTHMARRRKRVMPLTYWFTDDQGLTGAVLFAHSQAWFKYVRDRAHTLMVCGCCERAIRPGQWFWRSWDDPHPNDSQMLFGPGAMGEEIDLCFNCARLEGPPHAKRSLLEGDLWMDRLRATVGVEQRKAGRVLAGHEVARIARTLRSS